MPVIGLDCNGKPLHPGDRCVLLDARGRFAQLTGWRAGQVVVVVAQGVFCGDPSLVLEPPPHLGKAFELHSLGRDLRKLPKDQHRSADRSFEDLMRGIKSLMPEANYL